MASELPPGAPYVGVWTHVSCHSAQHLCFSVLAGVLLLIQVIYTHAGTRTHIQSCCDKHRRLKKGSETPAGCFLIVPFSFLCSSSLSHSLSYASTHTHRNTHINSPLGVCCFHYLQLGPETAFRVEYRAAELARIAVYIERSLVIASSLFSLSCASGGKYECVASGDHPTAPHLATTVCPPTGHK